jgi:chorismate synthase
MASILNNKISISVFGEPDSTSIGVVIDNLPPGEYIDTEKINKFLSREYNLCDSEENIVENEVPEKIHFEIKTGVYNNRTTGAPLCAAIKNNYSSESESSQNDNLIRPGHADYTGAVRYKGFNDVRRDDTFSVELSKGIAFAGAVCGHILERRGIYTGAHLLSVHKIKDTKFSKTNINRSDIISLREKNFPTIDENQGIKMYEDIVAAKHGSDSLGAVVECATVNVPAGVGSPIFDGLESTIAQIIFAIPGVKGIEFGAGFDSAKMTGSQNADEFYVDENGHIKTKTNNHGGILGGISSGMPITLSVAFKPSSVVKKSQNTVNISSMTNETITQTDASNSPCVGLSSLTCVESAVNIAILSHMLDYPNFI